jgi:hypothetical protein
MALLAAMPGQVSLSVSFEIQAADAATAGDWDLPDGGVHSATFPLDIARKAYVHR